MREYSPYVVEGRSGWSLTREQCSFAENYITTVPVEVGDNIRIRSRDNGNDAVYTVDRTHTEDGGEEWIRIDAGGRDRLYPDSVTTPTSFDLDFWTSVPDPRSKTETQADERGEALEKIVHHPTHELAVTAPHGGIEYRTTEQARVCHKHLHNSTLWECTHFDGIEGESGSFPRWHITSADISRRSYPGLRKIGMSFNAAVSFHGFSENEILVGGRAPDEIRDMVAEGLDELSSYDARRADNGEYDGDDPGNYINWLTADGDSGIQIEQPYSFRDNHAVEAARRVASIMHDYYD